MTTPGYMTGFGNDFATEAREGALPVGRNSPQRPPYGLYPEKHSAEAFSAPRARNARSWVYRIRPSVVHGDFNEIDSGLLRTAPANEVPVPPDPLRWQPLPLPEKPTDFIAGLVTIATNGSARLQAGIGIHVYRANAPMEGRFFYDADGELLLVPEQGELELHTEFGRLQVGPGHMALIPRGVRFRVALVGRTARGYVCENYGARFTLPERGPIGTDGLANGRDFETPVAAFEDLRGNFRLVAKQGGRLFECDIGHSPLDVVAWHGNLAPFRYDLTRFNTLGSISYDHPDPSIFTVLTSASDTPGTANVDFVVFPPRWLVAEDTFRPPWFHRNVMSEYMGLVYGEYDAKVGGGFAPGGASLHNCMTGHGPDDDTVAFMFESRYLIEPTAFAMTCDQRDRDYPSVWQSIESRYDG